MVKPADQNLQTFNTFITQLYGGALNDELSEKIRNCVQEISDACLDRGGEHKASLTLRLDFKMNHKDRVVEITIEKNSCSNGASSSFPAVRHIGHRTRANTRQVICAKSASTTVSGVHCPLPAAGRATVRTSR